MTRGLDPIAMMKAVKNPVEIEGARQAQRRDGAAVTRFLAWFDREAPRGQLTEIGAAEALESFRRDTGKLKDVSFPTIAGAGPNGAIVHYRVTRSSNRTIKPGELFLIDSGGQYQDGTTDITRTVAVGNPSTEMRERFTRVLKGHIAIARAVFPDGTTGAQLDPFARQALWQAGLDFDHGTGHGVGSYLSVHEGPARISKLGNTALKHGMILSNEPGYYKPAPTASGSRTWCWWCGAGGGRRREAAQCIRNTDIGADRSAADRAHAAHRRRDRLARRLSRARRGRADAPGRCRDAGLARRRDPPAWPRLRRPRGGRHQRQAPARPTARRSAAVGTPAAADGGDGDRPDHAQCGGAGAAGNGQSARLRRRHRPAHRFGLSAGAGGRPAPDGAAVGPLRPAAGAAGGADADRGGERRWRSASARSAA